MKDYHTVLSDKYLSGIERLLERDRQRIFPLVPGYTIGSAIGVAISDLIFYHVKIGHINPDEPHTIRQLVKKGFYINEPEAVRYAVRKLLKKENLWISKS
jgi:hypothetical protein